ncbi:MAG: redoxin domain-containing protein [Halanaerobiales bacterium]
MVIKKGKNPNGFTLPDQEGNDVNISDYEDKYKLLSFHPLAWTSVCAKQMKALDVHYDKLEDLNTIPFGISIDPVPTKKAWADHLGLDKLKILSDFYPLGFVAKIMDVFIETKGISGRANIILDPEGNVVWVKEYEIPELPDIEEVIEAVKKVQK